MPLINGMLMSMVMRSMCCSRTAVMANSPSLASRMVRSGKVWESLALNRLRINGSSSTRRITLGIWVEYIGIDSGDARGEGNIELLLNL